MKQGLFATILIIVAFAIAYVVYAYFLPDFLHRGGPLVVLLIMLSIMVFTYIFERIFSLRAARGGNQGHRDRHDNEAFIDRHLLLI